MACKGCRQRRNKFLASIEAEKNKPANTEDIIVDNRTPRQKRIAARSKRIAARNARIKARNEKAK